MTSSPAPTTAAPPFARCIGIDYSGAAEPERGLAGIRVHEATPDGAHRPVAAPGSTARRRRHWSRAALHDWLAERLDGDDALLVGIDHAFGLPADHLDRHGLADWDALLDDHARHWPCDTPGVTVESCRAGNPRTGDPRAERLTERWTAGAKSVFLFDVQGSVAKSTHAGLPWLRRLRREAPAAGRWHAWPFDGFTPPAGRSVVAEVFPSLVRRRFPRQDRTPDEHDAHAVARWLAGLVRSGALARYLDPPLDASERAIARREGWILGVA